MNETHLPKLITDLALILGAAGLVTLLFKWLRQPLVLGYIIAGYLVGPHFNLFPSVADPENITTWGEIGVIFLIFGLGLEFSFKKLIKVGGTAAITAIIGVSTTLVAGYLIGRVLHWPPMDCLFMGGILGISSTAIIIRAFDELGVRPRRFAGVVTGVLVIEDLVAVVLLVLLSTLAVSRDFSGSEMLTSVGKLGFFLMLWFLSGIFLIPSFLRIARKLMNDETMLVVSLALCFFMVYLATSAGFSAALGAFIMGSILSETVQGERIEQLLKPVRSLFSAVFFVSVGMMIDPKILAVYWLPVLLGTLVLLICKPFFAAIGSLVSGQSLKTAVRTGMSLSQIGEFSFIIAGLGTTLNVTSEFLYPVAVAISVVTAFTTPYMIRFSEPFERLIDSILPGPWRKRLQRYTSSAQSISQVSDWRRILRAYALNLAIYSVLLLAIILLMLWYLAPLLEWYNWPVGVAVATGLLLMSPFIWALAVRRSQQEAFGKLWLQPKFRGPLALMEALRIGLAIFFLGFMLDQLVSTLTAATVTVAVVILMAVFSRRLEAFHSRIETRFLANLNQKENHEKARTMPGLAPWDAHISLFSVGPDSALAGHSLLDLKLREDHGVNIAMIERGARMIITPDRYERLYPGDLLSVIGTDEQLEKFRRFIDQRPPDPRKTKQQQRQDVSLRRLPISSDSRFAGRNIRESGIREITRGIVVGIERDGERMLNPDSGEVIREEDVLWIVGNNRRLQVLLNEEGEA